MKKLLILASLIFAAFFIHNNRELIFENGSKIIERSTASVRMARLYAMEPDQQIAMPIRDVRVKQAMVLSHISSVLFFLNLFGDKILKEDFSFFQISIPITGNLG